MTPCDFTVPHEPGHAARVQLPLRTRYRCDAFGHDARRDLQALQLVNCEFDTAVRRLWHSRKEGYDHIGHMLRCAAVAAAQKDAPFDTQRTLAAVLERWGEKNVYTLDFAAALERHSTARDLPPASKKDAYHISMRSNGAYHAIAIANWALQTRFARTLQTIAGANH